MPDGHETARFGEEQKQDAIDDRQRVLEERAGSSVVCRGACATGPIGDERRDEVHERSFDARLQRLAHGRAVRVGCLDEAIQERPAAGGRQGARVQRAPEDREERRLIDGSFQIDLEKAPGVGALGVDGAEADTVEAERPARVVAQAFSHRRVPESSKVGVPRRDDQARGGSSLRRHAPDARSLRGQERDAACAEPEQRQQRRRAAGEERPDARRGPERPRGVAPPRAETRRGLVAIVFAEPTGEGDGKDAFGEIVGEKRAGQTWNHWRIPEGTSYEE